MKTTVTASIREWLVREAKDAIRKAYYEVSKSSEHRLNLVLRTHWIASVVAQDDGVLADGLLRTWEGDVHREIFGVKTARAT